MAGDCLTARSDLHPYDCGGEEEKCQHCLKTATPQHDPATCALCNHDLAAEGREAVEAELAETARVTAADVLRCRDHARPWCIDCEPAGGWPKLPKPADSEHLYIGAAPCGCVLFACIDAPESRSDTAKEVAACGVTVVKQETVGPY